VEIDRDRCADLAKRLGRVEHFLLLQGDCLAIDLDQLLADYPRFQHPTKVVANIPYNITGPLLQHLLGTIASPNSHPFERIVLLVQKEVALRLCAQPGHPHFGALSVRIQYLADCEFICDVPARAFQPPPKVDSAVVRLHPRPPVQPVQDAKLMERLIKQGFSSRRKMLRNNLKSLIEPTHLNQILLDLGLNPQARAEDLSVADWVHLSDRFLQFQSSAAVSD
jgi:16S rRNA (adenine1518-N6/adenine1519-N6)-dimethyltransferase